MGRTTRRQVGVALLTIVLGLGAMVQGRIIYVDDDALGAGDGSSWESAFAYLQDALVAAGDGDEIRVAQGLYKPDRGAGFAPAFRGATFALVNGVTLRGGYAGSTWVDPNARDILWYQTVLSGDLNGDDGPNFTNNLDNCSSGVVSSTENDANTVIEGFTITAGNASEGGGIACTLSEVQIRQCRIVGNRAQNDGGGIAVSGGHPLLADCIIAGNRVTAWGGGIYVQRMYKSTDPGVLTLEGCLVERNEAGGHGGGAYVHATTLDMRGCTFRGNQGGMTTGGRVSSRSSGGGIYIDLGQGGTCSDCTFIENTAAEAGGGAYVLTDDVMRFRDCTFQGNAAEEGAGLWDGSYGVSEVAGCTFKANVAEQYGGGIHSEGNLTLTRSTLEGNTAGRGGGLDGFFAYDAPPITDCVFQGNVAQKTDLVGVGGGAVYSGRKVVRGHVRIGAPTPILVRCRLVGNRAVGLPGGAVYNDNTTMTLTNCLIAGNVAFDGGGVYSYGYGTILTHCTLAQNRSERIVAVSDNDCHSTLDHCIVWDHDGRDVTLSALMAVHFSDIQGGWPGDGNIDVDPLFAAPGYWHGGISRPDDSDDFWVDGDYHLQSQGGRWDPVAQDWVQDESTSPCIDAGNPAGPIADEAFPNGGIMNLGAYAGTPKASKSYFGTEPCDQHFAGDINGDCEIGVADLLIVIQQWTEGVEPEPVEPPVTRR